MTHRSLIARFIGFFASLLFTMAAFMLVAWPDVFPLSLPAKLLFIFVLALLQFATQCICFLNVLSEKSPRWNLVIFISTLSIVVIVLIGSLWIMNHLNYNMMGMKS
jgi:cytochrome o ubiquinol oxidase operon protein cyoD